MELIGENQRAPIDGQYLTHLKEWGPEYEVHFQLRFTDGDETVLSKNLMRFTIFNYNHGKSGNAIPTFWIQSKRGRKNFLMATSINNEVQVWSELLGFIKVDRWYNVSVKQFKGDVSTFN